MTEIKTAKSSSFSRAELFDKCPLQFKYKHIDKIPDPRPDDPDKEHPLDRGTRIHTEAEHYVQGLGPLTDDLVPFRERFEKLRLLYKKGIVTLEEEIAFDRNWNRCDWFSPDAIYRMKADAVIQPNPENMIIIDYKTGKLDGNQIKHSQQCMEYAVSHGIIFPEVQVFTTQLWYLDQPMYDENPTIKTYTRERVLQRSADMRKRHQKVIDAVVFPAHPSRHACLFCPYKAGNVGTKKNSYAGTGHCRRNVC